MAAVWTPLGAHSAKGVQAVTEAAPAGAADGVGLDFVKAVTLWLEADEGQTIAADVGQVDIHQNDLGFWGPVPGLALPVPPGSAGQRRVQLGTLSIDNPRGRIAGICNGVQVSGGGATVYIASTALPYGKAAVKA